MESVEKSTLVRVGYDPLAVDATCGRLSPTAAVPPAGRRAAPRRLRSFLFGHGGLSAETDCPTGASRICWPVGCDPDRREPRVSHRRSDTGSAPGASANAAR